MVFLFVSIAPRTRPHPQVIDVDEVPRRGVNGIELFGLRLAIAARIRHPNLTLRASRVVRSFDTSTIPKHNTLT